MRGNIAFIAHNKKRRDESAQFVVEDPVVRDALLVMFDHLLSEWKMV
jgi:hypothetical protein